MSALITSSPCKVILTDSRCQDVDSSSWGNHPSAHHGYQISRAFHTTSTRAGKRAEKTGTARTAARPGGGGSQSRVARELRPFRSVLLSPSNCTSEIHLRQAHLNADKQKTHIFICIQIYIHTEKRLEKDAAK